jgi:OHCU decarboxylase
VTTTLADVNALDRSAFATLLGPAFEASPWIAEEAWAARPFASLDDLHGAMTAVIAAAPDARRVELIRAHPDLAGKAAIAGELTEASTREQASARLDRLTPAEHARFTELNEAYRDRFGFPFVICVRDHDKASILDAFEERLGHAREEEVDAALAQVARIARLRLEDAVA